MITATEALNRLLNHNELFYDEMTHLMRQIMQGEMEAEMMAALMVGLRMKVETVSEITAAANVLKEFSLTVSVPETDHLLDIVGTGGDGIKTFNISTTVMFVAAAAGAKVAKHGGKAVSSSCGAADVMERMGVNIDLTPDEIAQSIAKTNIGFMHAPKHNPAMKHVAPVRKTLGIRTIFNILGPLTNPANAKYQLLGVFHPDLLGICAHVGQQMGLKRMLVVHGSDGMDEITIAGTTQVTELKDAQIIRYELHPEQFNLPICEDLSSIQVFSTSESLKKMDAVLAGEKGTPRDIVLLNSAAALYCVGLVNDIDTGIKMAEEAIDSRKAQAKKQEFIQFSHQLQKQSKK